MYESHFGFSHPPFQLNPDPAFYFESKGHANALSYLKFGVFQGEGFIVVTGEVGAGKTTLVRTLLGALDRERVVAAQVVSTQLDSGDLLRSIVAAFGISGVTGSQSKAELILALEGFLTALAARNRRALLVVDEAQNLSLEAIEELRMLSNFQLGSHALLQSFLVGQPELRAMLQSPTMLQFRQRVIASCHLGPLDSGETRAYVEHRLRRAGWKAAPSFEDTAFAAIHEACGGVPRRINLLCNRVLLTCYLAGEAAVTQALVRQVAQDLRNEVGEVSVAPVALSRPAAPALAAVGDEPDSDEPAAGGTRRATLSRAHLRTALAGTTEPLLFVVDTPSGRLRAGAFARTAMAFNKMPPVLVLSLVPEDAGPAWAEATPGVPAPPLEVRLSVPAGARFAVTAAELMLNLDMVIDEARPLAVLSSGCSDAALACSLLAGKRGLHQVRLDGGQRRSEPGTAEGFNAVVLDRLADLLMTSRLTAHYTLHREGIPSERVVNVGSLLSDVLQQALPYAVDPATTLGKADAPQELLRHPRGYALCTLRLDGAQMDSEQIGSAGAVLAGISRELPVVWLVDDVTRRVIKESRIDSLLRQGQVVTVHLGSFLGTLGLLRAARLVLAGAAERELQEEATTLGLPCLLLGTAAAMTGGDESSQGFVGLDLNRALRRVAECLEVTPRPEDIEAAGSDETAKRMLDHLRIWLPKARRAAMARARVGT